MKALPVFLLAAGIVRAPEIAHGDSVEWMVYDADVIVVGTVAQAKAEPDAPQTNLTCAVRALGHFPSEKNIQRLNKLLADGGHWIIEKSRHYPVRIEASRILRDWKQDFSPPVTEEPLKD